MADQSAIRIPQGQLPINLVDTVMNLYCSPGGSDTLGDGSITNPYFHPSRALEDLKRLFFTETGSAIIQCSSGTYNYEYPIVVDNQTKKKISIKGATGLSFKLQEVTSYKYDAHENIGGNGYGVGSLVDNRITVKLASTSDLSPPPTTPVSPSVNNIAVGDYILFRDETSKSSQYYPTGKDGSLGSEGLAGPNPGDARTNVLGCYEIIAVDNTDNTVTFRSRGKNFLHKIGKSKIDWSPTDGDDITLDDDIYVGGYRSFNGSETGDPRGKYGTLQTTGIDTGNLVSDHAISARIMKSIFKWKRPNNSGSGSATKGLVLKANSSLHTLSDLVFQGDVRFKHFNEMDPAASNGEAILAFKNSSIGNGVCQNIGISGWYAGVAAHTNSSINLEGICISDCSFGIVAENNSTITSNNGVITGCDVVGVVANGNSIIKTTNTTVGSAGYSPLAIDLDNIGSDAAGLESGDYLTLSVDDVVVTTRCVWNSFRDSYNRMIDPVFDLYNYYPMNTGNQIYLKSMWPIAPALGSRDESTNEISPNRIITSGGFVYGVGQGVLPENSSTSSYTPDEACDDDQNRDLTGGVCLPPGFFGDPFDFPSTGAAADDGSDDVQCNCTTCTQCRLGQCGDVCFDFCCRCQQFSCDHPNDCNPNPCDCFEDCDPGGNPCGGDGEPPCPPDCDGDDQCTSDCKPGIGDDGLCSWCEQCGMPGEGADGCHCQCGSDACCSGPTSCECLTGDECCDVDCSDPDNCSSSTCCCNDTDATGKPCFCTNPSCSSGGSVCEGQPGVFLECTDCPDGECPCPPGTDNEFLCNRPCNVDPPDETTYRLIDHPMGIGFLAYNNSSIDAPRCYVSLLRNGGFVAIENSSIDANISFVRGCAGPGFLSSDNSSIDARHSSAQRTRGGYTARQNSNIQAQMSYARDNAEYNFIARNDSIINCQNATSVISRTMASQPTETVASITTANPIYAGLSNAHGQVNFGSFINKTGIIELEGSNVTPNGADKWAVDASSNIEPTNAD